MPLCPLCFRNSIHRDAFWCPSCGNKLNAKNDRKALRARIATVGISRESIALALRIVDKMNEPKLLTAPPEVLMLTLEPANRKMPIDLQREIQGKFQGPNAHNKPVLANMMSPLSIREEQWKKGEEMRIAELRKEVDGVEKHLKDQLAKHSLYLTGANSLSSKKASMGGAPAWLTLPELDKINWQIDDELKKTPLKSKQDFDRIFVLQQSAVDYLKGVEDCLPDCQVVVELLNSDPDTKNDFQRRFGKLQTFINNHPATMNAGKLSQIDMLKRQVTQSRGMRLLWKDALDKIDQRLAYMVSADGFKMKTDSPQVQNWRKEFDALALMARRNPLTLTPINTGIAKLNAAIELEAKDKERGRNNSALNSAADEEKRSLRPGNRIGGAVYWTSLSAEKQQLAKCIKHGKPIPGNWERKGHNSHPGGNGSEYRLWSGPVGAVGSALGGLRMTSVGRTAYNCSAHSSNSAYDYLPVVGIPDWDAKPALPVDFPAAPGPVALLPL